MEPLEQPLVHNKMVNRQVHMKQGNPFHTREEEEVVALVEPLVHNKMVNRKVRMKENIHYRTVVVEER